MEHAFEQILTWLKENIFNAAVWTIWNLNSPTGNIWLIPVYIAFIEALTLGMFVIYYLFYESN